MRRIRIIFLILTFIAMLNITYNYVYAESFSDAMDAAEKFVKDGDSKVSSTIDEGKMREASSTIFNILLAIGTAAATIIGVVLGIQFLISGIDEQAQIKQALVPYVVGCVIVFGAFGIWKIVIELMNNVG